MIIAKDINEACAKSLANKGETVHFPGGAIRFVDEIKSGGAVKRLAEWRGFRPPI